MKVLCLDCDSPFGANPGGQSAFTHDFVLSMASELEITLATLGPVESARSDGINYDSVVARGVMSRRNLFKFSVKGRRFIRSHQDFDVVIEQFTSPIGPLGLPRTTKTPVIGIACFSFWDEMSSKYHLPFSYLTRKRLVRYHWLVANHVSVAEKLRALSPSAEVIVIEQQLSEGPGKVPSNVGYTALFMGRADVHQKGLDLLAQALELVNIPGLVVEIAGFSENDPKWRRVAGTRHFQCDVRYLGYVKGIEKTLAFERARVVLVPSRYEGPGMVVLEAANYGVPTVAFDLRCFSDRREGMILAPELSGRDFADAMERAWFEEATYKRARSKCVELAKAMRGTSQAAAFRDFVERVAKSNPNALETQ